MTPDIALHLLWKRLISRPRAIKHWGPHVGNPAKVVMDWGTRHTGQINRCPRCEWHDINDLRWEWGWIPGGPYSKLDEPTGRYGYYF